MRRTGEYTNESEKKKGGPKRKERKKIFQTKNSGRRGLRGKEKRLVTGNSGLPYQDIRDTGGRPRVDVYYVILCSQGTRETSRKPQRDTGNRFKSYVGSGGRTTWNKGKNFGNKEGGDTDGKRKWNAGGK